MMTTDVKMTMKLFKTSLKLTKVKESVLRFENTSILILTFREISKKKIYYIAF